MGRKPAARTNPPIDRAETPEASVGIMTSSGVKILDAQEYIVLKALQKLLTPRAARTAANDTPQPSTLSADYPTRWGGDLNSFGKFLLEHNINRVKFARKFGITPAYVSMLTHGDRSPALQLALDILDWTREEGLPSFGPEDWPRRGSHRGGQS